MVCLVGMSASGKSSIANLLTKSGLTNIVTYTTRPIREGEKDGVNYHYINNEEFLKLASENFFAEYTYFDMVNGDKWYYGTPLSECKDDRIIVVDPRGLRALKQYTDLNIISFLIVIPANERIIRMAKRGDQPMELFRRFFVDTGAFYGVSDEVDYVIDNSGCIYNTVKKIEKILNQRGVI